AASTAELLKGSTVGEGSESPQPTAGRGKPSGPAIRLLPTSPGTSAEPEMSGTPEMVTCPEAVRGENGAGSPPPPPGGAGAGPQTPPSPGTGPMPPASMGAGADSVRFPRPKVGAPALPSPGSSAATPSALPWLPCAARWGTAGADRPGGDVGRATPGSIG